MYAQKSYEGTVLVLSQKIGTEVDSLENIYYEIFPDIPRLKKAYFFTDSNNLIFAKLFLYKQNTLITKSWPISEKSFQEKKTNVDLKLPMPDTWLYERSGKKRLDENASMLEKIKIGTEIKIKENNGDTYRGLVKQNQNRKFILKSTLFSNTIPYISIKECQIYYPRERTAKARKWIILTNTLAFSASAYALRNTNASGDKQTYFVLSGSLLGYFTSKYLYNYIYKKFPHSQKVPLLQKK